MRRIAPSLSVHAASLGVIVLAVSVSAQRAERPGTIGELRLPGGLQAAMNAVADPAPPDRARFLVEFIRRTYDTPVAAKNDPRDASLRSLLSQLKAAEAAEGFDTLPLPLSVRTWTDVVFAGRATPWTLVSAILQSQSASLLYTGLLALDDDTRAWFDGHPDLVGDVARRSGVAFLAAAPGIRIDGSRLRLPGGEAADPIWKALVGKRPDDGPAFVKALLESDEGRLARFAGDAASLTPAQLRLLLNLDSTDIPARVDAGQRVYSVYRRLVPKTMLRHAIVRPLLDPVLLAADLERDGSGTASVPGTRAFWDAAFDQSSNRAADNEHADTAAATGSGVPADFAWLCEQVFKSDVDQRGRYSMVLFAARFAGFAEAVPGDALDAVRGSASYPALTAALRRARVSDIAIYAAVVRRAAAISAIDDEARQRRALAQFQGALALMTRAAARGSLDPRQSSDFARGLAAIALSDRGDYEGRLACWLDTWVRARAGRQPDAAGSAAAMPEDQVIGRLPGAFEQAAVGLLAGPIPSQPRFVDWEGTRYRVDLRQAEAARIVKAMGNAPRPYVSAAESLVAAADSLAAAGLTRDRLRQIATEVAGTATRSAPDGTADEPGSNAEAAETEVVKSLDRAARNGNTSAAARLAPELRVLADRLMARGLMELAYAAALGDRDGLSITASDAARRHDFFVRRPINRASAWGRPVQGTDAEQHWRVAGALLGLDAALADFSLVRLSLKPPRHPMLIDADRRTFIDHVGLVEPARLTDADRDAIVAAIRSGRRQLEASQTPEEGAAIAGRAGLDAIDRSLLPWVLAHDRERAAALLSPRDLFGLGLEGAPPGALHAWGMPAGARFDCFCVQLSGPGESRLAAGRWNSGMTASAFPDLNLRLAELLADLRMPAELLSPVLRSATLDFINSAVSRDPDDRRGLVAYVNGLHADRVEQYLALLTTDGPLVPIAPTASPGSRDAGAPDGFIAGAHR